MELPEYEVIRRDLEREAGGKKIASIAVHRPKLLVETTEKELTEGTEGIKVSNVERLGPYLVFRLAGGQAMTIRLGAGSWLRKDIPEKAKSKSRKTDSSPPRPEPESDLVISFTQGKPIRLNDPEKTCECGCWPRRTSPPCPTPQRWAWTSWRPRCRGCRSAMRCCAAAAS
ncbi:MAG: hypothetical protein IPF88_00025 [Candidatus Microthrix sp.]|nr:hypothetical protein [Candidatus Microthrix sp.]